MPIWRVLARLWGSRARGWPPGRPGGGAARACAAGGPRGAGGRGGARGPLRGRHPGAAGGGSRGAPGRRGARPLPREPVRCAGRPPPLLPGQRVRVEARLGAGAPPANPGEKDFRRPRRRRALAFTGSFRTRGAAGALPRSRLAAVRGARRRRGSRRRCARVAPSADAAALFLTLAAGQRAALDDALEEAFSRSGLAHVLSVSGLHVAALALMTLALLRLGARAAPGPRLARRWTRGGWRRPRPCPSSGPTSLFTGNQPPAVRSAVMATVVLLGLALWRRADGLNSLAAAAALLVAWAPSSVVDLSLQLSFLAVLQPAAAHPRPARGPPAARLPDPRGAPRAQRCSRQRAGDACWRRSARAPRSRWRACPWWPRAFGRVSLAGLVSNIVCLPLCGAAHRPRRGRRGALRGRARAGHAGAVGAAPGPRELLLCLTRLLRRACPGHGGPARLRRGASRALYARGARWRGRSARGAGASAGCSRPRGCSLAAAAAACSRPSPGLRITFLSVGQGDAIVLSSRGHHALVDGGGVPGGADTGRALRPPLPAQHERIERLDLAVLSHPHPDHALGLRLHAGAGAHRAPVAARGQHGRAPVPAGSCAAARAARRWRRWRRGHALLRAGRGDPGGAGPAPRTACCWRA